MTLVVSHWSVSGQIITPRFQGINPCLVFHDRQAHLRCLRVPRSTAHIIASQPHAVLQLRYARRPAVDGCRQERQLVAESGKTGLDGGATEGGFSGGTPGVQGVGDCGKLVGMSLGRGHLSRVDDGDFVKHRHRILITIITATNGVADVAES